MTDSNSGGPPFDWVGNDISLTGTEITDGFDHDDLDFGLVPIAPASFPFSFYGASHSQIRVSSNGYVGFGTGYAQIPSGMLPEPDATEPEIMLWNADTYAYGATTHIYYQELANPQRFVIQFDNLGFIAAAGDVSIQAIFYPNGDITVQYQSVGDAGRPPGMVGMELNNALVAVGPTPVEALAITYFWDVDILVDNGHGNFELIPPTALDNWRALQEAQGHVVHFGSDFSILSEYRTLVLFLPNVAYTAAEVQAIDDFLQGGGRVILVGEYGAFMQAGGIDVVLNPLGLPYGVRFANTVVEDPSSHDGIPEWIVSTSLDDFSEYTAGVLAMVEYAASSLDLSLEAIPLISGSANAIVSSLSFLALSELDASLPLDHDRAPAGSVRTEAIAPGAPVLMGYNQIGASGGEVLAIGDISLFLDSDPDNDGIGSLSEYSNAVFHSNLTNP